MNKNIANMLLGEIKLNLPLIKINVIHFRFFNLFINQMKWVYEA